MGLLDEVQDINMEGFQVVSSDLFCNYQRADAPTITLWIDQISFSKAAVNALNNCERVRMEVNSQTKGILLIPVSAKDKDSIRWMLSGKEPHGRKLECRAFAEKLFQMWGWNADRVYKSTGRIVVSDQKVMLFFDFNSPDSWLYGSRAKAQKT